MIEQEAHEIKGLFDIVRTNRLLIIKCLFLFSKLERINKTRI